MNKLTLCFAIFIAIMTVKADDYNTILFTGNAKDKVGRTARVLYRMDIDGTKRTMLTSPEDQWTRTSSVSALGKKIAVLIKYRIHVMDWDGQSNVDITPIPREHFQPSWSPDGKQIAFTTDRNNDAEIYLMNYDGSNARNLTWSSGSSDMSATWSPDGEQIAFISNRKGKFELYVMDKDGFNQRRIVSLDGDIREPAWGANNKLAFALQKGGTSNLYVVNPTGRELKKLTDDHCWNGQPAWNWNATKLAFVSTKAGNPDIWTMDIVSGEMRNITQTPDDDEFYPTWVPKQIASSPLQVKKGNLKGTVLSRPRMLFTSQMLPGIRKRFATSPYKDVWKYYLKRCDSWLNPDSKESQAVKKSIVETKNNKSLGLYNRQAWITAVFKLAFAYQVTQEKKYGDQAVKWLLAAAEEHRQFHGVMQLEYPTACAYDWLYDLMPDKQRDALTKLLETTVKLSYLGTLRHKLCLGPLSEGKSNIGVYQAASLGAGALVLSGEPGADPDWLAAAIRLTTMCFNNWIDDKGCCIEGFSYFAAPMRQILPFVVSLKINGIGDSVVNSNLKNFTNWMAISAAHGVTETVNIGDCDNFAPWIPLGLLAMYPNDQTLKKLWNQIPRGAAPETKVKSLLWWQPSIGGQQDFSGLPKAEIFYNQGYVVLRSGYKADSPMMTLCAPSEPGHTHAECGSVMLYGYGERFLVDPGQGVSDADYHNQPLINGRGRGFSFQKATQNLISLDAVSDLGAIASADLQEAFSAKVDLYMDYAIPGGWLPIKYGSRYLAMVHNDSDGIPPYFLIYDSIRVDDKKHRFEQLFMTDLGKQAEIGNHQFVIKSALNGGFFKPNPGKKGTINYTFNVKQRGEYTIWIYVKYPGLFHELEIDGKAYRGIAPPTFTRKICWQWQKLTAPNTKPITIQLDKGQHSLVVNRVGDGSLFANILLTTDLKLDLCGDGSEPVKLPENAIMLNVAEGKVTGQAYALQVDKKQAKALVACLNPAPVKIAERKMSYRTRFYGQKRITLPQIRTERKAVNPHFLTLLYPSSAGMEKPSITRKRNCLQTTIRWQNAVDTINVNQDGTPMIVREYKNGKKMFLKSSRKKQND